MISSPIPLRDLPTPRTDRIRDAYGTASDPCVKGFMHQYADLARQLEQEVTKVRTALVSLVGVDTPEELHQMKGAITVMLAGRPPEEQAGILAAIDALLEVRPS